MFAVIVCWDACSGCFLGMFAVNAYLDACLVCLSGCLPGCLPDEFAYNALEEERQTFYRRCESYEEDGGSADAGEDVELADGDAVAE